MARAGFSLTQTMTAPPAVGPWPGTTTATNLDWEKQQQDQMKAALEGLGTLATQAEAAQFQRQQESQQAQAAYMAAVQGPMNMAPPLSMALPYAAAQFSSALSGQPQVGEQANQSLALNRAMQLQRRSQVLDQLATQTQEAARRAESAGDLTNALKFNTKANLYLKQIDEAGQGMREAHKTAVDQTFEAWKTDRNNRADYFNRLVAAGASDPRLAARLFALKERHDAEIKSLDNQIETTPVKDRGPLMAKHDAINNGYTHQVEVALSGGSIEPPPPPPPPPPPAAEPKRGLAAGMGRLLYSDEVRATDALRAIPNFDPKEALRWLSQRDSSGTPNYQRLGQTIGIAAKDSSVIMKAARKLAGVKRAVAGRPPQFSEAELKQIYGR